MLLIVVEKAQEASQMASREFDKLERERVQHSPDTSQNVDLQFSVSRIVCITPHYINPLCFQCHPEQWIISCLSDTISKARDGS